MCCGGLALQLLLQASLSGTLQVQVSSCGKAAGGGAAASGPHRHIFEGSTEAPYRGWCIWLQVWEASTLNAHTMQVIKSHKTATAPYEVFGIRAMLAVPYFEKALVSKLGGGEGGRGTSCPAFHPCKASGAPHLCTGIIDPALLCTSSHRHKAAP